MFSQLVFGLGYFTNDYIFVIHLYSQMIVTYVCIVRLHSVITIVYSRFNSRYNLSDYECIYLEYPCVTSISPHVICGVYP